MTANKEGMEEGINTVYAIIESKKNDFINNHNGRRAQILKINKDIYKMIMNFLKIKGFSMREFEQNINLKIQTINEEEIKLL